MKFSCLSMAFFAAVAAKSVGASDASASSLRGRGYDKDSSIMTPTRLLKKPDALPAQAQANVNVPELPSAAQDNANAYGKAQGGPFADDASETPSASPSAKPSVTLSASPSAKPSDKPSLSPSETPSASPSVKPSATPSTTAGCGGSTSSCPGDWKICQQYCYTSICFKFFTCPSSAAVGTTIGESFLSGTTFQINLDSSTSDKVITFS
jgi:hypothetical protein